MILRDNSIITKNLGLTDPALSNEARYTRNLSLADIFSPFQDVPSGPDFMPAGSFYSPPDYIGQPGIQIEKK